VAEEKEKQHLLGWLQAPVRECDWLAAKLVLGILLSLSSIFLLQVLGGGGGAYVGGLVAILGAGSFCFGALGICLGLLCRNQASARTLGMLCYLPMLLPAALSDMSQELRMIAPWVPSYHLFEPIRVMLVEHRGGGWGFVVSWCWLVAVGLLASLASLRLIRRRWLM
jgi:ABC-2 type transport system permease protein